MAAKLIVVGFELQWDSTFLSWFCNKFGKQITKQKKRMQNVCVRKVDWYEVTAEIIIVYSRDVPKIESCVHL